MKLYLCIFHFFERYKGSSISERKLLCVSPQLHPTPYLPRAPEHDPREILSFVWHHLHLSPEWGAGSRSEQEQVRKWHRGPHEWDSTTEIPPSEGETEEAEDPQEGAYGGWLWRPWPCILNPWPPMVRYQISFVWDVIYAR